MRRFTGTEENSHRSCPFRSMEQLGRDTRPTLAKRRRHPNSASPPEPSTSVTPLVRPNAPLSIVLGAERGTAPSSPARAQTSAGSRSGEPESVASVSALRLLTPNWQSRRGRCARSSTASSMSCGRAARGACCQTTCCHGGRFTAGSPPGATTGALNGYHTSRRWPDRL